MRSEKQVIEQLLGFAREEDRIRLVGMEPTPTTPEEFAAFLDSEIAKAEKLQNLGDGKPN